MPKKINKIKLKEGLHELMKYLTNRVEIVIKNNYEAMEKSKRSIGIERITTPKKIYNDTLADLNTNIFDYYNIAQQFINITKYHKQIHKKITDFRNKSETLLDKL